MHVPLFDGENPKLWQSRCEVYFRMYEVDYVVWVRVATMQFSGAAARWLQSVEYQLDHMSWEHFCALITKRFAKNQHQMLLRQLFHIRQSSSMSVYIDEFSQLVDQLNAYQRMSDPLYYTMKFVDGLRDDIKAVVMLQRPKDFDTAAVLAQLQEEAGEMVKKHDYRKASTGFLSSTSPFGLAVQSQQEGSKDYKSSYPMKPDDKKTLGSSTNSLIFICLSQSTSIVLQMWS